MMDSRTRYRMWSRQTDLVKREGVAMLDNILIVGCGSLGSHAALALASMGFTKFTLWDDDAVGEENIFPTIYNMDDVDCQKVDVLAHLLKLNGAAEVEIHDERVTPEHELGMMGPYGIAVLAVDDWQAREWLFESVVSDWIMDTRMGGAVGFLYTIDMMNEQQTAHYMREMHTAQPGELACGQKATAAVVNWVRWRVAANATAIVNDQQPKFMGRYDMSSDLQIYPNLITE